jgi:hypothetical protein
MIPKRHSCVAWRMWARLWVCYSSPPMGRKRLLFWVIAVSSGAYQAWTYRFWIEPDGVNYLDIAANYLHHDWASAINPYWSPLYSWLLAGTFYLIRASAYWESTLLHILNFAVFLVALRCGEFLIAEVVSAREADSLPAWALWWIGYCILVFVSLFMISVYVDTPDLCVSALVYFDTGLLLRIRSKRASRSTFVLFGLILGVAYLAKTVMFLVAFAFLFAAGRSRRIALSLGCFAAISLPWILLLSHAEKRLTYGDAGWSNYCFYVASSGTPIHPPRIVLAKPEIREFALPIAATYPLQFNAIHWMEGVHPRFDMRAQLLVVRRTGREYLHELSGHKEFIAAFLVLLVLSRRRAFQWRVAWPAFAAIGLYGLVHVETRLIGPFFLTLWLILFSGLRALETPLASRVTVWVCLAVVLATGFKILRAAANARYETHVQWATASALRELGLVPGSHVAYFSSLYSEADYWAHLGYLQVSADLQEDHTSEFWLLPTSVQQQVFIRLAKAGIKAVLIKSNRHADRWQQISGTPYSVLFLNQ